MILVGHVQYMATEKYVYSFIRKSACKKLLRTPRSIWKAHVRMNLARVDGSWFKQNSTATSCKHRDKLSGSMKEGNFLITGAKVVIEGPAHYSSLLYRRDKEGINLGHETCRIVGREACG
jgi:hypothetical protein